MRVLLVEDEEALAETLAAGLRADGFAIDIARDGVQALTRIQTTEYDTMVLDITLPGPSGYEVVRRPAGRTQPTPDACWACQSAAGRPRGSIEPRAV